MVAVDRPLSPASFNKRVADQAKLLLLNSINVSERFAKAFNLNRSGRATPLSKPSTSMEEVKAQIGVKRPRDQETAGEIDELVNPAETNKRQKTEGGDDLPISSNNPEASLKGSSDLTSQLPPGQVNMVVGMAQTHTLTNSSV